MAGEEGGGAGVEGGGGCVVGWEGSDCRVEMEWADMVR